MMFVASMWMPRLTNKVDSGTRCRLLVRLARRYSPLTFTHLGIA